MAVNAITHSNLPDQLDDRPRSLSDRFAKFSTHAATIAGSYKSFILMLAIVLVWAVSGPFFGFSTAWQLVINTGTTIITFLMVFLIQNTQNRDTLAIHLKLDELIRAIDKADDELIRAEDESEEELAELKHRYQEIMLAQRKLLREAVAEHVEERKAGAAGAPAPEQSPATG